jgi:hypothetical protein
MANRVVAGSPAVDSGCNPSGVGCWSFVDGTNSVGSLSIPSPQVIVPHGPPSNASRVTSTPEQFDALRNAVCVPRRSLESVASIVRLPDHAGLGLLAARRSNTSVELPAPRTTWRQQSQTLAIVQSRHTPALRSLAENGQGFF